MRNGRRPRTGSAQPVTGIGLAVVMLAVIFVGGVLGYMVIEGWSFWDAFYMTVITVTTVGYREIHPMSRVGEVFTSVLLLVGVGTALSTHSRWPPRSWSKAACRSALGRRRVARMIDDLEQHFIVCGFGRIGTGHRRRVRSAAESRSCSSSAIRSACRRRSTRGMLAVEADASHEDDAQQARISSGPAGWWPPSAPTPRTSTPS